MSNSAQSTSARAKETDAATLIPEGDRGYVEVNQNHCKGCELCVTFCPTEVLEISKGLNVHGYHPAEYEGHGCTGCAICFYVCPEPGAITVYRREGR